MSKELDKFKARYKNLAPLAKVHSLEAANAAKKALGLAAGDASASGESHVHEAMATARDNGVTGDKLADFMKDREFASAVAVFKKAVAGVKEKREYLAAICAGARETNVQLAKLVADIDKDLKSRKDKSASKTDIENLKAEIETVMAELKKAGALEATLVPRDNAYGDKFDDHIARIFKKAPEAQEIARDNTMLPQMLVDRNRKAQVSKALAALRRVNEACEKAIEAAADDPAGAQPFLVTAAQDVALITKLRDEFKKAVDHSDKSRALDGTKDEAAVRKALSDLDKAQDAATRKLRGTATTLKKAKV